MSTHNTCFRGEIRKISCGYPLLSVAMCIHPKYLDTFNHNTADPCCFGGIKLNLLALASNCGKSTKVKSLVIHLTVPCPLPPWVSWVGTWLQMTGALLKQNMHNYNMGTIKIWDLHNSRWKRVLGKYFSYFSMRIYTIMKTRLFKYIENFTTKNWKFSDKNSDILHISAQNLDCGYLLEPPHKGSSNEYPQSMFLSRNRKNNVYPCKPQFYYIKVGFK